MLPNISLYHPDYSLIDVRNQYSILNRMKSKDVLASFSYDLEWKLPRINQRLRYLDDKENQLTDLENRLYLQNKYLQQFQNMLGCHCQCPGHKCNHQTPRPQQEPKKPQKTPVKKNNNSQENKKNQRRKLLLKKFRKYAYAVYFTIFIKHFSTKFTKNRYTFFRDRYLVNDGQKVKQDSFKITKSLEGINLLPLILESPHDMNRISKLKIDSSKLISTKSTVKLIPDNPAERFMKAINFVNLYLKQFQQIVLSKKFVDYYAQIIGIGTLNQSFYMDQLMIPQQIQFITFSEKKGFAQIQPKTQKVLIMTYIFAKHVLFKILLRLREKKYLENNLVGDFGKYRGEMQKIYEFLQQANGILYTLVNSVFLQFLDQNPDLHTNYENLKKRFKISPAKVLTAPSCPKEIKEIVNNRELILGVPKTNQVQAELQNFMYREYINYLMGLIEGISERLLNQVRYVNKAVYEHIKQETLQQKYLIFEGLKNEETSKANSKTMRTNRDNYMNESKLASSNKINNFSRVNIPNKNNNGMKSSVNMKSSKQLNNNSQNNMNISSNLKSPRNNPILPNMISNTSLGDNVFRRVKQ